MTPAGPSPTRGALLCDSQTVGSASTEVDRLVGLGAVLVREVDDPEDTYVVLLDPEGNEFCVCSVDDPDR